MRRLDVPIFGLVKRQQFIRNVLGVLGTSVFAECSTSPEELILDPNAVAVVWVETESILSLGVRRFHDPLGKGLWCEASDLDVKTQSLKTVCQDSLICSVPVCVEKIYHLVFGEVWVCDHSERIAEAYQRCTSCFVGHVIVGLCLRRAEQLIDGVKVGEESRWGCRAIVEHEEDRAGNSVEKIEWQSESEDACQQQVKL